MNHDGYPHISWMHSGERLNKLSTQFIEYAALQANGKNRPFLKQLRLFQFTKTCKILPKQVNIHQIRYVAPKYVKNSQNI